MVHHRGSLSNLGWPNLPDQKDAQKKVISVMRVHPISVAKKTVHLGIFIVGLWAY